MPTVLIVDDRPINRQFLVSLLRYKGYQLAEAADGAEALALARTVHPDLIISDIRMPTMDGYEFVEHLRADPQLANMTVMFYTATFHEQEVRERAVGYGVSHVLSKPSTPRLILDTVETILGVTQPAVAPPPSSRAQEARVLGELQLMSMRMNALVELGMELSDTIDPAVLLKRVCQTARRVIEADLAAIGISSTDGSQIERFVLVDSRASDQPPINPPAVGSGILSQPLPCRLAGLAGKPYELGFAPEHPPVYSLLAVPISTPTRRYGWLYIANKSDASAFSESDERLALTLAAQAALAYENSERRSQIERYTMLLEHELAERQRAEMALQVAANKLQRSNRELQDFAHVASHDLQEPLRKIDAFGELIQTRYAAILPTEGRDYLDRLRNAARRMQHLITDLLELSRVTSSTQPHKQVDLTSIARDVIDDLEARIQQTGGQVKIGTLPRIEADPLQMRQLLQNLLGNALKFHRPGVPPVITLTSQPVAANTSLELMIIDNGIGFDEKYRERIFAPFQRLHGRSQYEGSGMGLAICKRIVERHHGEISVSSRPGQGTTFRVRLPLTQPTSNDVTVQFYRGTTEGTE